MRITVEGNIASGKSTILRFLGLLPQFKIVLEPLTKWQKLDAATHQQQSLSSLSSASTSSSSSSYASPSSSPPPAHHQALALEERAIREHRATSNLLETFYKDPVRWAFTFQIFVLQSRLNQAIDEEVDEDGALDDAATVSKQAKMMEAQTGQEPIYIFERSIFADKYCFAKNCYENNLFSDIEWHVYNSWFNFLVSSPFQRPQPISGASPQTRLRETELPKCVIPREKLMYDGIIYLRTLPETCHYRLRKRNRVEEETVPLDYLTSLHARHEEWLLPDLSQEEISDAVATDDFARLPRVHFPETGQIIPVLILDCNGDWSRPSSDQIGFSESERRAIWESRALQRILWFFGHLERA